MVLSAAVAVVLHSGGGSSRHGAQKPAAARSHSASTASAARVRWRTSSGVSPRISQVPRAARDAVAGVRAGCLLVRLTAPPLEGRANEALVRLKEDRIDGSAVLVVD